jgi:hypothetical protein
VFGDDSAPAGINIIARAFPRPHVVVVILQNEKPIPANKQMLVKTRWRRRERLSSLWTHARRRAFIQPARPPAIK